MLAIAVSLTLRSFIYAKQTHLMSVLEVAVTTGIYVTEHLFKKIVVNLTEILFPGGINAAITRTLHSNLDTHFPVRLISVFFQNRFYSFHCAFRCRPQ